MGRHAITISVESNKVNSCGHPERPHYAKGKCLNCYRNDYRRANPHYQRNWLAANPSYHKERARRLRATNPDWAEKERIRHRKYGIELRNKVLEKFGAKCANCGFTDARALQIDHVNGGGAEELQTSQTHSYYKKLLESDGAGYQLLCANCNWIKRHELKEYGGKSDSTRHIRGHRKYGRTKAAC